MKKGKELKLDKFRDYSVAYGGVSNRASRAMYICILSWAEPRQKGNINYDKVIKELDRSVRQTIFRELSGPDALFLRERTITDFDIKCSGVRPGKRSFLNLEVTLFMREETIIGSPALNHAAEHLISSIIESVLEETKHFRFHKKKR